MSSTLDPPGQGLSAEEKRRLLGQLLQRKAARATRFPLSFAQQRLWFLHQLDPASPLYNMFSAFRLRGPLDAAALERAFAEIVRRHEALRTVFAADAGEPVQVVTPPGSWRMQVEELVGLPEAEREAEARRRVRAEAVRPFDLAAGPLFRVLLLRCGPEEHLLFLGVHHIVSDGWSMEVLFRELDALYAASLRGEPSPLAEPPIQYADFAVWQRERLRGPALEPLLGYWRERLAGAPAVLELPADRPRPAAQSFRGATLPVSLDAGLTQELHRVGRREGGTLFMALLAAFGVLLARYAGTEDVVVGTPVAGRTRRETEGLVGLFINTLALRIDLDGDPTFAGLVGRVREMLLGAHAHQELPFDRLVEELHVERSLSHGPVFQALLSMQGLPRPFELGGARAVPYPAESGTSKFDLSLVLQEEASTLFGYLEFSTELFEAATVERMRGHLRTLLEGVAAAPGERVSALPLLAAAERRQLLEEWNQVERTYPAERTLHALFAGQAGRAPEAVAVAYEGERLSYGELERRSNRLAHRLRRLGVGPEARVGLCVERSPEMLVGILGILKAGGAYVPLDPAYPAERLAYVLDDCGAAVLVTQEALLSALPGHGIRTVCLDRDRAEIERESAEAPRDGAAPGSLAYVIYTSGSTGRPKGVMVTHANVVRLFAATRAWFGFGAEDAWTLFHSFAFDFSVWEIWGALLHGGRLVVVPHLTTRSPEEFHALLRREGVTVLNQTPSAFRQLIQAEAEADAGAASDLALRVVVFGGEALEPESLRPWMDRHGDERPRLVNMYGITETTVHVTYRPITRRDLEPGRGSVIGRAIPDLRIYLLDAHGQPVPAGVAGEMYVGGAGVARGYLDREELTGERFLADPFRPGERVYRSGDLARYRADGELEYLGRADQQVKVRGFRIEPGEVEAALLAQPGVREAVVVARGEGAEQRLVAYVAGEGELDAGGLRDGVRERLPEYMVPAAVVVLESIPLTPNGKTDRRALPEPQWGVPEEAYLAPRTEVEEVLCGVWAQVLGAERVGVRDDFFDLGGHSLLATRVVARAQAALGTEIPLRVLFEAPTVAGLAGWVEAARRAGAGVQAAPIVPAPRTGPLPLSFAQARLWFIDQLQPGSAAYNMPFPLRLRGPLDARALAGALGEIVRRHESLRTVFRAAGGEPAQVVMPAGRFVLPVVDLGGLPAAARDAEARRQARADAARPFDLSRGPLLRTALLRTGEGEADLLVTLHHIVSDGWSIGVLFGELSALYPALAAGASSPLPEPPVQYADYALWQRAQLSEEVLEGQLGYWRERLRGAPPLLELPTDRPRPQVQGSEAAGHRFALSPATARGLRALARRESATPFMTLLAGLQALLWRWSGQDDVVVGTPIAGRTQPELEGLIGFFANTLVLRAELSAAEGFGALLGRVREATLGAFAHQELPFERLVEELAPGRSLRHTPLFQVMFALQPRDGSGPLRLGNVAAEPLSGIAQGAKFDLALAMEDAGERYEGGLLYRRELWDAATTGRMVDHFVALLDAVAADPDRPLSEVEILGDAERARVLEEWGAAGVRAEAGPPVYERFSEQAARTPEAPAVRFGAEVLSYAGLEARADRLAGALRGLGVGAETRVGLCTRRGPEMLVGVLGIWKAGGAYVPLDPDYPAERLAFMLRDAAVPVLVTQPELAAELPEHGAAVVTTDGILLGSHSAEPGALSHSRTFALSHSSPSPDDLAYVIYTSGSTGRPKGVRVTHRALASTLRAAGEAFGFQAGDEMPGLASFAFDIWLLESLLPLLHGGTVRPVPRERVLDVAALVDDLSGATLLHAVPALMRQVVDRVRETRGTLPGLRRAFVGGDAVPPELLGEMREVFPAAEVRVLYGPTEATIICVSHHATGGEAGERHLLGRPIGNAPLYVLDATGGAAPLGVPGELCIGGPSVARDYLGRPELTAERFVPDPFSGAPGARMYRSGDRARWGGDGVLEFLGRLDEQVKIRGFRIEPGEVEAALAAHPGVREAVVAVREDTPGDKRLVAYLVPAEREPVELWPSLGEHFVYDELIYHGLTGDERRHASYRVALEKLVPGRVVVDVGTGGDAVLARMCVEAGARKVYAIEIMEQSYQLAKRRIAAAGMEDRITLIHGDATRVELPEPADVCVSEIVEAIAGAEGAAAILGSARRFLREGGVFVPERNVTRIAAVSLPDALYERPAFTEVSAHYVERIFEQVGHRFDIRLCIKNFPQENLLSEMGIFEDQDFRGPVECEYDRELTLSITRDGRFDGFLLWLRLYTLGDEVMDILEHRTAWFPVFFPVFHPGVPVAAGDRIRATCSARLSANGVNPDYEIRGSLLRAGGEVVPFAHRSAHHEPLYRATAYHALLFRDDGLAVERSAPPAGLAGEAREHLRERLPEYMVPGAFVLLDRLPLSPNGKVDRRALPAPQGSAAESVPPRTPTEEILAGIWCDVLRRERVGATEDFFELGGHSLLATQVVARVRASLGVELPLRALFEAHTVAGLAARTDALLREGAGGAAEPVVRVPRDDAPLPLSFAQQRLWLIDRLEPGSAAYNVPFRLRLRGGLDVRALAGALGEIVRRHEALRTVFHAVEGGPVQVVLPAAPPPLPVVDLAGLPDGAREAEARRLMAEDAVRPFDLARGPLLRAALLRAAEGDAVLLGNVHHIAFDGSSLAVFLRELAALYPALAAGRASPLPELPVQYADFAAWQRAHLSDEALRGQLACWRERLAGIPPLLELPTDRPRPAVAGDRGGVVGLALPVQTAAALRALARREGATLFTVLLAGFQALLARYAGSADVPVGTAVAGRTRLETEGLIGFFVDTLVLRGDLAGSPTGRGLVEQARERVLEAHVHQDVPFERLVEELRVERTRAHAPLFQVMFTFDPVVRGEGLRLGDVEAELLPAPGAREKFDLTLGMGDDGERLEGGLSYRTDLWEAATIERMAGHFAALLEGLAREPERRVAELPLLDAAEREMVLEEWNATGRPYPAGECVHDLFAAQAARTPDAVAVSWRGEPTRYAELDRRSRRLAGALRRRGVGPESRVGVCLPRTPELLVALLGVLRAGGAYVPLDPAYPRERLGWMLEDAGIALVLTESGLAGRLPEGAADLLLLDREDLTAEPDGAPESGVLPENLSHVIFTSGSTGRPKGVMIRHASTTVLLHWLRETVSDDERASVLFSTSVSFDVSVAEVFGTLCWGGRLVLVENALELATLAEPVVYASMVPSAAAELLRAGGIPASVRTLNLGGEALPAALARGLYSLGHVERVGNLYGPTEDTTYSTYSRVEPGAARVSIGRPVANTRAYVLDAELQPAPVGVAGELYLAGAGLARGYAGRPELTAERWLPDPFGAPGARMYRVMDRVRRLATGELEYLGRTDFQVKVRGFRIELGEIEAVLGRHPAVREAVATVWEDAPGDRRIVAYVTGADVSAAELRAHAAAHLPEYMVPSAAVVLERFPLTPSGKTDRRALPPPGSSPAERGGEPLAPRDEAELALVRIWEEVLGVERVGVRDDFFALGGHSLLAVRLLARVERATGVRLPLAVLFTAPTVERLAAELRRERPEGERSSLVPIRPEGEGTPLFLVHPVGGNVLAYAALARHLDPGRPVYALRSRGLAAAEAPAATVEEMAADYLRAVRDVQPAGPYRIGGWSMGGVVAFEMARRLEAAGEEVETLALIDAHIPALLGRALPGDERVLVRAFAADLGLPPGELELVGDDGGGSYLRRVLGSAHAAGLLPADVDAARMEQLYAVFRSNLAALHAYAPKPYGGAVLLLRAAEHDPADTDTAGWERVAAGGVELHLVPGSHFTLLREPHAAALAPLLEGRPAVRGPRAADHSPMEETACR